MELEKLRLECLKIAAALNIPADQVLAFAKRLFDFVIGGTNVT